MIRFNRSFEFRYETPEPVGPCLRRIVARNPKDYTFAGTNTFLLGDDEVAIIDPGPALKPHIEAILAALGGAPVTAILVTHSHKDHSPAAAILRDETGAPVFGHGRIDARIATQTEEDVDTDFAPDALLGDGSDIYVDGHHLQAVHTPGHFPNHLCFRWTEANILFSGDHVMGWSTTVISPPLGDLGEYLASLDKLLGLDADLYLPSHGPAIEAPRRYVTDLIAHRRERDRQIRACLAAGHCDPAAIVARIYRGLTPRLVRAARQSVRAHLNHLEKIGVLVDGRLVGDEGIAPEAVAISSL